MLSQLPKSKHFQIERLADGIYAAVASEQGYAICNAGIVDIGDKTIFFDTFISPDAAKDLLKAAKQLTSHKTACVINSHYHNDHIRGNQVFSPISILLAPLGPVKQLPKMSLKKSDGKRRTSPKELSMRS